MIAEGSPHRPTWRGPAVCAVPVLVAVVMFGSAFADDAYISFGAARRLASGSFGNYNGDHLEQSSSLLHVLVLTLVHRVSRLSLPWVAWLVGLAGAVVTVVATMRLSRQVAPERPAWLAGLLVGTSVPTVYWAVGGLETTLAAGLFTAATAVLVAHTHADTVSSRRSILVASAAVCGFVTCRPEAASVLLAGLAFASVASCVLAASASERRRVVRRAGHGVGMVVGALAIVTSARLVLTGRVWPNPVSAKVRGLDVRRGLVYLATSLDRVSTLAFVASLVIATVAAWQAWRRRDAAMVGVAAYLLAAGGAVVATGGDWMVGGRFLAPLLPLVAVLAVSVDVRRHALVAGLLALQCVGLIMFATTDSRGVPLWSSVRSDLTGTRSADGWPESRSRGALSDLATAPRLQQLVDDLAEQVDGPVVIASGQAGMTLYYLFATSHTDVRFIDRFQLSTDDFGQCDDLLSRSVYGASITYSAWGANEERCGVAMPDVIFELGRFEQFPGLEDYTLVYQQEGTIDLDGAPLGVVDVSAEQFLAVRTALLPSP